MSRSGYISVMSRRVVVTGMGVITPIGSGIDTFWRGLREGSSGVRSVEDRVDLEGIDVKIGAPVVDFDPLEYMDARKARRIDRSTQLALAASAMALDDAACRERPLPPDRVGVVAGTGIGGLESMSESFGVMLKSGPRRVSPFFVPRMMPNALAGQISIETGLRGPNFGVVSACASAAHAIGVGGELIRSGFMDGAIVGGAEAVLLRIAFAGFARMGALSKRNDAPERASRPFDLRRDGFVIGEGAGFLLLEEREVALRRGAGIHAELVGFGMTADAHHITAPPQDGAGAAQAIRLALRQAGISPDQVEYVNAHGTSTLPNDRAETHAIKESLGTSALKVKVSSTKSQVGHLLGAAGGVEAVATILAIKHGFVPATLNYENPDPECDLDYTPQAVEMPIEVALSNSFGFGGQNAALVFRRYDDGAAS